MRKKDDLITLTSGKTRPFNLGKVIALDTESKRYPDNDGETQRLWCYDLYDGQGHYYGHTKAELLDHVHLLRKIYRKITIIAHNFEYDTRTSGLLEDALINKNLDGLRRTRIYWANNMLFVRFSSGSNNNKKFKSKSHNVKTYIQLLDTFNYFKVKLEEMMHEVNKGKYASKEDYALDPDKWNIYIQKKGKALVQSDTEGLYAYFSDFLKQENVCIGVTVPDTAMRTFKKDYLKRDITIPKWANNIALESYRGGRVEAYNLANEKYLYAYDVNSLYPYVMRNNKYSVRFIREIKEPENQFDRPFI